MASSIHACVIPTFVLSGSLIILGVGGYYATGRTSKTALIPAYVGGLFLGFGALGIANGGALLEMMRWAALGLSSLTALGMLRAMVSWLRSLGSEQSVGPATVSKGVMALLALAHIASSLTL